MRLHQIFVHKTRRTKNEVLWFSDYNKIVMILDKSEANAIPTMLSLESFYENYEPIVEKRGV